MTSLAAFNNAAKKLVNIASSELLLQEVQLLRQTRKFVTACDNQSLKPIFDLIYWGQYSYLLCNESKHISNLEVAFLDKDQVDSDVRVKLSNGSFKRLTLCGRWFYRNFPDLFTSQTVNLDDGSTFSFLMAKPFSPLTHIAVYSVSFFICK